MRSTDSYFCIDDFVAGARRYLPRMMFDFAAGAVFDDVTFRRNRSAFQRYILKQRVLVDISTRDIGIDLFGKRRDLPLIIAPTGPAGMVRYKGEVALARQAAATGIPFTLSSASSTPLEEVARDGGGDCWFQLYVSPDLPRSYEVVRRAETAGYEALVLTVDSNFGHARERDLKNGLTIPYGLNRRNAFDLLSHPGWLTTTVLPYLMRGGIPGFPNFATARDDQGNERFLKFPGFNWSHLDELRSAWPRKLILKGILTPEDARRAADAGADAIIVSNHGGNVFDAAPATLDALPTIVEAVGDRMTVIVDGGVRRGSDVVTAMALGADAVMIGRATLLALAAAGEPGVKCALDILRGEIDHTLAMIGQPELARVDDSIVSRAPA
ncbi:MAG: alpha-hydroxy-acid oxidizing protein [Maritimibacter sp.]|jgi:isopentenyl diphosphate isomerase/L-lactate dehydrogenase-like FMN-dependent dehydrogenase|uniref:alpha-hydroxy acid oxidase n=1 Tax=Maritimibacter sp. TaxID=2003363 RepID=UPI001DC3F6DA|nr:alpha-hydroxy acid oxidase [Maritimibacter sp.]MBL6430246.1 alpha-hydroxy-acid oxidizing protein [Maritimibacter sp.]